MSSWLTFLSIAVLNMPFENDGTDSGLKDYSGYGNDGTETGSVVWNSTGGFDGFGAYEFDGVDIFFGYVKGDFDEYGTFSLSELESVRGAMGLTIERDIHFRSKPLSECK